MIISVSSASISTWQEDGLTLHRSTVSKSRMRNSLLAIVLMFVIGSATGDWAQYSKSLSEADTALPFSISLVPTSSHEEPLGRGISIAKKSPGYLYVVLTNISSQSQVVFEDWNSWGYQSVSFEGQAADGRRFVISRKSHPFTMNFPSTFIVPAGEHMVYAIALDDEWKAVPSVPIADATPILVTLKAIYEVKPSPEATKGEVWTGRLESHSYQVKLRHWQK